MRSKVTEISHFENTNNEKRRNNCEEDGRVSSTISQPCRTDGTGSLLNLEYSVTREGPVRSKYRSPTRIASPCCITHGSSPTRSCSSKDFTSDASSKQRRDAEDDDSYGNRSRSIDFGGSNIRSCSTEVRQRTSQSPVRNLATLAARDTVSYDVDESKHRVTNQQVILSRGTSGARRHTLATTASGMQYPTRNGLKQKLTSGKHAITMDKLLPNYKPRKKLQSSVSLDASDETGSSGSTGNSGSSGSTGISRRDSTAAAPLLPVTWDDFPEPPPAEEDLNARMELLFEQYRQIELGFVFKDTLEESSLSRDQQSHDKRPRDQLPVGRRDRNASVVTQKSDAKHLVDDAKARNTCRDQTVVRESKIPRQGFSRSTAKDAGNLTRIRSSSVSDVRNTNCSRGPSLTGKGFEPHNSESLGSTTFGRPRTPSLPRKPPQEGPPASGLIQKELSRSAISLHDRKTLRRETDVKSFQPVKLHSVASTNSAATSSSSSSSSSTTDNAMKINKGSSVPKSHRHSLTTPCGSSTSKEGLNSGPANGEGLCPRSGSVPNNTTNVVNRSDNNEHVTPEPGVSGGFFEVPQSHCNFKGLKSPASVNAQDGVQPETKTGKKNRKEDASIGAENGTGIVGQCDDGTKVGLPLGTVKATLRRDSQHESMTQIPLPVYTMRHYSTSLKRCDSGVDISIQCPPSPAEHQALERHSSDSKSSRNDRYELKSSCVTDDKSCVENRRSVTNSSLEDEYY